MAAAVATPGLEPDLHLRKRRYSGAGRAGDEKDLPAADAGGMTVRIPGRPWRGRAAQRRRDMDLRR